MDTWLLCYDITDDRRRDRVASWLLRFGERVQKSVFEITVKDERHYNRMWRGIRERIKPDAGDHVRAYPFTQITLKQVQVFGGTAPETPGYAKIL